MAQQQTDFKSKFEADMRKLLNEGGPHAVTFKLKDGEITAPKNILAARSEYFATMFSGNNSTKFIEGQTNTIDMNHVEKKIMQVVIDYLFTGNLDYSKLMMDQLLNLMDVLRLYLLNEEMQSVSNHISTKVMSLSYSPNLKADVIDALLIAKELKFDHLIAAFVGNIQRHLPRFFPRSANPGMCSLCQSKNGTNDEPRSAEAKALAKYPYEVFKEIFLTNKPSASIDFGTKVRAFNNWFAANEKKLEAEKVIEMFKDYRIFVNDDHGNSQQYNNGYHNRRQQHCQCGGLFYY